MWKLIHPTKHIIFCLISSSYVLLYLFWIYSACVQSVAPVMFLWKCSCYVLSWVRSMFRLQFCLCSVYVSSCVPSMFRKQFHLCSVYVLSWVPSIFWIQFSLCLGYVKPTDFQTKRAKSKKSLTGHPEYKLRLSLEFCLGGLATVLWWFVDIWTIKLWCWGEAEQMIHKTPFLSRSSCLNL